MTEKIVASGKITVLPADLVNRIAAGEVVERPASVVKELVENSIDAGSRRIQVEVKAGGGVLIRLQDDGEGMPKEDALLAFQRHATSKIRSDEDLLSVETLGFRGEALPSIAAVSKVRLVTQPAGSQVGTEVLIEGGQMIRVQEAGAPPGTLIEVRDLFFNTPARKKFLKSVSTELSHISHIIQQQAMAHPQISFRLAHDGRSLMDLPSVSDRMQRIQQVYGKALTDDLIVIENEWANIKFWGTVSKPPHTRGTRAYQEVFVNRRPVSSPLILRAVYEGYEVSLMKGQHPVVFLFLEMDGPTLDVNVHPAKREVRFQNQSLVYDLVREGVRAGIKKASRAEAQTPGLSPGIWEGGAVNEAEGTYGRSPRPGPAAPPEPVSGFSSAPDPFSSTGGSSIDAGVKESGLAGVFDDVFPLGQIHGTYIVANIHGDLWVVDQHAAHERVLYERLLDSIRRSRIPVQRLLIPQTVELPAAQSLILEKCRVQLEALGMEIEPFGPQTVLVRAVPAFMERADLQGLIADLVEDWIHLEKSSSPQERESHLVATMACHSAVRAHDRLTLPEMKELLGDLLRVPEAGTCPHGRPLKVKFGLKELESLFCR